MKKLFVVLFAFVASSLFADMDPQTFFYTLNLRLGISTYATVKFDDFSREMTVAEAREGDVNNDGYVFFSQSLSFTSDQYTILNVNTRHAVTLFLSNDPDFPQILSRNNWRNYGDIFTYSNLKEQLLIDYESALQRLGMRTRRTRDSINGFVR